MIQTSLLGADFSQTSGQMMGAETRARANTWATAMLVGALIGIIIVTVTPSILKLLYPGQADNFYCGTKIG